MATRASTKTKKKTSSRNPKQWKKFSVPAALTLLASIAGITGYNLNNLTEPPNAPAKRTDLAETPNASTIRTDTAPRIEQTTFGSQSPAVITNGGDANIYYGDENWEEAGKQKPKKGH